MNIHFRYVALVVLVGLRATLLNAQTIAQLDTFIVRQMDLNHVPGLSLAIIQNNKIAYAKGFGLTKADSTQRVDNETIFDAASLSKPVFAYAVLQLVDEGIIDLDKPLYEYLPYPDVASDERYKKITARMVLAHRTGFPNWRKNRKLPKMDLIFTPNERFGYSGEGFVYLQKVVEKITGKPINTFMTERVFKPLQMTRSSYVWQAAFDQNFAFAHTKDGTPSPHYTSNRANTAYSLQTTATDYARFLLAILTPTGLKERSVEQMLSSQGKIPKKFGDTTALSPTLSWGMGFGLEHTNQGDYFWHWGDNDTYKCYVVGSRKQQKAYVFFTNSFNGLRLIGPMNQQILGFEPATLAFLQYND